MHHSFCISGSWTCCCRLRWSSMCCARGWDFASAWAAFCFGASVGPVLFGPCGAIGFGVCSGISGALQVGFGHAVLGTSWTRSSAGAGTGSYSPCGVGVGCLAPCQGEDATDGSLRFSLMVSCWSSDSRVSVPLSLLLLISLIGWSGVSLLGPVLTQRGSVQGYF
jgi:hypothetical protein